MRYPCLVPKKLCKVDIHVHLESEDVNNHGEPEQVADLDLKCNFQDRAKTILTAEKKLVPVSYTHLDVYKRQKVQGFKVHSNGR